MSEALEEAWRAQLARSTIEPMLALRPEGLVLGAGTVLAPSEGEGRSKALRLKGREDRVLTLLPAAYGRRVGADTLAHIRRAGDRWEAGDNVLAGIHLALTGLGKLSPALEAAQRLFLVDGLMEAGAEPDDILKALGLGITFSDPTNKYFNPDQPRVPAGNGRMSGQWAEVGEGVLEDLSEGALAGLAGLATKAMAPTVFLGVLLFPTNAGGGKQVIEVPGHPGLRVIRYTDSFDWHVVEDTPSGVEQAVLQQNDGVLRDEKGNVVGHVFPDGYVALDLTSVAPSRVRPDEPRLCPAPTPDKFGQGPDSIARVYEDQVKRVVNPDAPTPSGFGVALANPSKGGDLVVFDDCQKDTGIMVEAKGPTYGTILAKAKASTFGDNLFRELDDQSGRQVQAAQGRGMRWYFADASTADIARTRFREQDKGRERIEIVVLPFIGGGK